MGELERYPDLKGKIALVTGSTSGIGKETARQLAANGATVYINGRTEERALTAVADIGDGCLPAPCDVADREAVRGLVDRIVAEQGELDILVNNADWHSRLVWFAESEPKQDWYPYANVALWGQINCAHAAVQHMIERKRGAILNVSGGSADEGVLGYAVPGAMKGAIASFAMHLAKEMAWHGVRVNAVTPHIVDTPALQRSAASVAGTELERLSTAAWEAQAPRAVATPAEAAEVYTFLCSEASSYISGEVVKVNGGRIIAR